MALSIKRSLLEPGHFIKKLILKYISTIMVKEVLLHLFGCSSFCNVVLGQFGVIHPEAEIRTNPVLYFGPLNSVMVSFSLFIIYDMTLLLFFF